MTTKYQCIAHGLSGSGVTAEAAARAACSPCWAAQRALAVEGDRQTKFFRRIDRKPPAEVPRVYAPGTVGADVAELEHALGLSADPHAAAVLEAAVLPLGSGGGGGSVVIPGHAGARERIRMIGDCFGPLSAAPLPPDALVESGVVSPELATLRFGSSAIKLERVTYTATPSQEPTSPPRTPGVYESEPSDTLREALCGPLPPAAGPRVGGIDPGSHWIAAVVAEVDGDGLRHVASKTFEVGRLVQRVKPRIVKRADGTERILTHRRIITDADVEAAADEVLAFLVTHGAMWVAVERATHFHGGSDAASAGARAAGLLRAQWVGGEITGALRAAHVLDAGAVADRNLELALVPLFDSVETVSATEWRAHAKRKFLPIWQDAVRVVFGGTLPAGEHVLDAAGVCLWAVREPESERRTMTRRDAPTTPKEKKERDQKRVAMRRAAVRQAAGCKCMPGKQHAPECPIQIAANAARSEKAKKNRNAAKEVAA